MVEAAAGVRIDVIPSARRRHALELDQAQAARLARLWRLLGRVGEREFRPKRN